MNTLQGKNAIITGGSRGLGKATAIALAEQGVNIAITGRNEETLTAVAAELAQYDIKVWYAAFDISNATDVAEAMQYFKEEMVHIDILINNAGIAAFGTFNEMEPGVWRSIMETNLFGMYYCIKAILPTMIAQNSGDIINISSTAGLNGNATTSAYSASKFAVIGMSESLMKEVRKNNIRVITLTPSTIATDMAKDLNLTDGNEERVLQPEDFAALIVDALLLPRRALLKSASLWSTNP